MITKNTADYRKAQNLANKIFDNANSGKEYGQLTWFEFQDFMEEIVNKVISNAKGFPVEVAKTVKNSIREWGFGRQVARCSSKQAWILACTIIENNIEIF